MGPGRPGHTSKLGWSGSVMSETGELWRAMHFDPQGKGDMEENDPAPARCGLWKSAGKTRFPEACLFKGV